MALLDKILVEGSLHFESAIAGPNSIISCSLPSGAGLLLRFLFFGGAAACISCGGCGVGSGSGSGSGLGTGKASSGGVNKSVNA